MNTYQEQDLLNRNVELETELAAKNRELEIEAALERVRTAAMAMKEPADMLEVCKIISNQLEILDVKKIRNVQTAIFYEEKSTYMNYEYYAKHDKVLVTEVDYNNHPVAEKFANQMLKGPNQVWTHGFKGEEVKDWLKYQRSTNVFIDSYLETADSLNYYWYSLGPVALGMSTYVPLNENEIDLFKRFRNVFELAYRRYLDIEKAQAQAREAQIEAALERVRSKTMAMHKSEELAEVATVMFEQMSLLDDTPERFNIRIINEAERAFEFWATDQEGHLVNKFFKAEFDKSPVVQQMYSSWKAKEKILILDLYGDQLSQWVYYIKDVLGVPFNIEHLKEHRFLSSIFFSHGMIGITTNDTPGLETLKLIERFAIVFEQTYTRFLDLQKAEAQAREAQIEAALERVRSRSLAMHQSNELEEVIMVVSEQLQQLQFRFHNVSFVRYNEKHGLNFWLASPGRQYPFLIEVPYLDNPVFNRPLEAFKNQVDFFEDVLTPEENHQWLKHLIEHSVLKNFSDEDKKNLLNTTRYARSLVLMKHTILVIGNYAAVPYTEEQNLILKRFAKVFDQAYTRFLDLQKAEAQAREAKIEVALERTRTQSMLMQHSKELDDTLRVFHEQVLLLGINSAFSFLWLPDEDKERHIFWAAWAENVSINPLSKKDATVFKSKAINYPLDRNEPATAQCLVDWKGKEPVVSYHVPPAGVESYFAAWQELISGVEQLKPEYFSDGLYYVEAFMKYGCFGVMVESELPEDEKKILGRFAVEFERTYTRFLDLQKAEAQAREAQIEASLERVRSRTSAMFKSSELAELMTTIFKSITSLGIPDEQLEVCYITTFDQEKAVGEIYLTNRIDGSFMPDPYTIPFDEEPFFKTIYERWNKGDSFYVGHLKDQQLYDHFQYMRSKTSLPALQTQEEITNQLKETFTHALYFSQGYLAIVTRQEVPSFYPIFKRFGNVLQQTYTRFLDLQKAEAQAREALIEAALERVRARALAMQQPEELKDVAQVLRNEMGALGVEELETCSIYIHGDSSENVECWYALQDPKHTEKKMVSDHFVLNLDDTWVGRKMKKFFGSGEKQTSIVMQGMNRKEWIKYCYEHSPVFSGFYGDTIPDRTYHLYKFSHGYIGAAAPSDISGESWKLLGRAASVFSLAYSRFKDLTQARNDLIQLKEEKKRAEDALTELQTTQKQLIQAEKMASLGELTAGIAHEIQNPLNFVNNFSDVSNELLEEMKAELEKGNAKEAKAIAIDVKENLEKILHHGKRADAIVKGMLQHSRTSSGQKEPTDINVLTEEYLRLAYHGLRAKDKFFNAKFETDLDPSINKINIVPQEIGRVILNLINNSFYAVSEKKRSVSNGYEPSVTVSTKKINDKVEIRVVDNGNGIPQKVLDKIFQPFFTTKPTGQGTGLGLSLSYDIVTKGHDGEIKVETKEGEGSAFIISLPMK